MAALEAAAQCAHDRARGKTAFFVALARENWVIG